MVILVRFLRDPCAPSCLSSWSVCLLDSIQQSHQCKVKGSHQCRPGMRQEPWLRWKAWLGIRTGHSVSRIRSHIRHLLLFRQVDRHSGVTAWWISVLCGFGRASPRWVVGWIGYRLLPNWALSNPLISVDSHLFSANNIGAAADDDDRQIKPLERFISIYAFRARFSTSEWLYIRPYCILIPRARAIAWRIGRCGASVSAFVLLMTFTNSENLAGMKFPLYAGTLLAAASVLR